MASIMVIDDDANIRAILQYRLEKENFGVQLAANGTEALAELNIRRPDIIILDIMMPQMDGLQFLTVLRDNPLTHGIPVIVLTALGHGFRNSTTNHLKAFSIITKPFSPRLLVQKIREALNIHQMNKAPQLVPVQ